MNRAGALVAAVVAATEISWTGRASGGHRRRHRNPGGGLVTLGGQHRRRILHLNTCDRGEVWTTSHCDDQAEPRLVVSRMR